MTNLRKAAEMALKFCNDLGELGGPYPYVNGTGVVFDSRQVSKALRQALAQPEQMTDKEKVAQWMIQKGYATGHGDTVEDLLKELEWQIAENWTNALVKGVEGEREACAKVCNLIAKEIDDTNGTATYCAKAIRARSEK